MDFGGELFWVVLLIFYLVFQVLGARKKKQQHQRKRPAEQGPQPASTASEQETELDEALREIRRALGFPDEQREGQRQGETTTPPQVETGTPQRVERTHPQQDEAATPQQIEMATPQHAEPARRTVGKPIERPAPQRPVPPREPSRVPPIVRETQVKRYPERRTAKPAGGIYTAAEKAKFGRPSAFEKLDKHPSEALAPIERRTSPALVPPETRKASRLTHIVSRLQNASSARQAFLIKEILDVPRAMRGRR